MLHLPWRRQSRVDRTTRFARRSFPPEEIELIPPFGIPLLNTFILLASGGTITWAHHALRENDRKNFMVFLLLTIILGIIFTGFKHTSINMLLFQLMKEFIHQHFIWQQVFMAPRYNSTLFLICFRGLTGHFNAKKTSWI